MSVSDTSEMKTLLLFVSGIEAFTKKKNALHLYLSSLDTFITADISSHAHDNTLVSS